MLEEIYRITMKKIWFWKGKNTEYPTFWIKITLNSWMITPFSVINTGPITPLFLKIPTQKLIPMKNYTKCISNNHKCKIIKYTPPPFFIFKKFLKID